jgi:hypothetical protein
VDRPGDEILERLAQGDFAPERFVLLEQQFDASRLPPPAPPSQPVTPVRFDPTTGTDVESAAGVVHILQYADDALRFDVAATQNAMLLVTDLVYPGWKAYVDGAETPIYRGDALFRTIYIPAGRHAVEMRYRPRSFRLGLLVTLASTVVIGGALLALSGVSGIRRRRRPRYAPGGAPVS